MACSSTAPGRQGSSSPGSQASSETRRERRRAAVADSTTLETQCHPRKIFIGGLAHKTTTQQLREYFSHYGPIVDAVVLRWPDGRSRGFGYITFSEASSASAVLRQSHQVGGRQIEVKRAVPGTNKLFVGGLPQNTAATDLREHFEAYGVVSDAVVMIDPATGRSRGFGFVCFLPGQEGAAAVAAALDQYDNHRLHGKWIEVKSAASPHKLAAKENDRSSPTPSEDAALRSNDQGTRRQRTPPGPVTHQRPLASPPHRSNRQSKQVPGEPCKVTLPGMSASLAGMGTPPGLPPLLNEALLPMVPPVGHLPLSGVLGMPGLMAPFPGMQAVGGPGEMGDLFPESNALVQSLELLLRQQSLASTMEKVETTHAVPAMRGRLQACQ